jgi:hypothetical protein
LVLAPSWVSEEDGEARARAVGATTIIKPFVPAAPVEVLREALEELALLLEADLAADPGPALRGAAAFGPRSAVQESLRRMERVRSALEGQ